MKLTGKTQSQLDKEFNDKLIDEAQDEANKIIFDTLRKIALDRLVNEKEKK